jgi:hypothetical protein
MEQVESPICRGCGKPMTFATRVTMPRQSVYRCEPCREQAWILDRKNAKGQIARLSCPTFPEVRESRVDPVC